MAGNARVRCGCGAGGQRAAGWKRGRWLFSSPTAPAADPFQTRLCACAAKTGNRSELRGHARVRGGRTGEPSREKAQTCSWHTHLDGAAAGVRAAAGLAKTLAGVRRRQRCRGERGKARRKYFGQVARAGRNQQRAGGRRSRQMTAGRNNPPRAARRCRRCRSFRQQPTRPLWRIAASAKS